MNKDSSTSSQVISLPQGGGALRGIGEKFSPDLHTGTGNFTVPIALPPGRNGFQPQLNLVYSTGNGNGPFGLGWSLSIPGVSRQTSKGLPRYDDKKDIFILSGAEDLAPVAGSYPGSVQYRPRTEGLFACIEHVHDSANNHWEVRSKDGLVSFYGTKGPTGADPATITDHDHGKNGHVFAWKLTQTCDPFGNLILYDYGERDQGNQNGHRWNQPLLSRIRYVDYGDPPQFLVSVTFSYEARTDAFSDYRAGFEVRWSKRCSTITIKTHADRERTVRQYRFEYEHDPHNGVSLLKRIHVIGYDDDGNAYDAADDDTSPHKRQLPPLEFGYTRFEPQGRKFQAVQGTELPASALANPNLELVDLHGNGLPDMLEMNGTPRYWRNRGGGHFDLPRLMRDGPAHALSDPGVQMLDANGDGRMDLMVTNGALAGYYPLTYNASWDQRSFQKYSSPPSFNLEDPEVRLIDLDGDGVTDAIRSGTSLECVYNDPHAGWSTVVPVHRKSLDVFPNVNFSDPRVKFADMTGDNLQDIVLVYDGNVEYWPNLGYGRWGKRIHMDNSPRFQDYGYTFGYDPRRILVGDVDGDGLADIVYVGDCRVTLWINQSGNSWSNPIQIRGTPPVTDLDAVRLVDLLGTGVSGVLWSADANGNGRPHMYFLDFTGGVKPYVLNEMDNHMGATTRVQYAPSTKFYLDDAQKPATRWKTPLPFPVQVVERVEVIDAISRGKLTTQYRYHHGYWDGAEREFRGFGMVEQLDTETFERYNANGLHGDGVDFDHVDDDAAGTRMRKQFFSPPTLTRTWFHQGPVGEEFGEWQELDRSAEYWPGDPKLLDHTRRVNRFLVSYPQSPKSRRIKRDALRALRGSILRSELYALDGTERQARPYTVTEHAYGMREVDPPEDGESERLRIFFPHAVAQRTTQWERGDDPMTQFAFTGEYDRYGQPHAQISIAVPRGRQHDTAIPASQPAPEPYLAIHTLTDYAQRDDDRYIVNRVVRTTTYEIKNDGRDDIARLKSRIESGSLDLPDKVIGQTYNYYDGAEFVGLPLGQIGAYGALTRTESLVLTEQILRDGYRSGDQVLTPAEEPPYLARSGTPTWTAEYPQVFQKALPALAGYVFHAGGQPDQIDVRGFFAETERRSYDFQQPTSSGKGRGLVLAQLDPLGHKTTITYDLELLPREVKDAVGLTTVAAYNYRVMQPRQVTDPNGNQTAFTFSPLGLLSETWVKGNPSKTEGDRAQPSVRLRYDFLAFLQSRQPISVRTIRQIHHDTETDIPEPERSETIETVEYSDGFGRLLQTRTQGEQVRFGNARFGDGVVPLRQGDAADREPVRGVENRSTAAPNVVVSGWQTYDNKGRVVEKYEPFFDTGWDFLPPDKDQLGRKAVMFYDPRGQVIRTLNPDGSEQRVIYGAPLDLDDPTRFTPTPWEAYSYDANDNAGRTHPAAALAYWHHWSTPSSIVLDALGRTVLAVERNRAKAARPSDPLPPIEEYRTRSTYDIRGNLLVVADALGRSAFQCVYDLANRSLRVKSIDAGVRRSVFDAVGNVIEGRDSKGALVLHAYDVLNRPTHLWARDTAGVGVTLRQRLSYGDDPAAGLTQAELDAGNLRGRLYRHDDEAGRLTCAALDANDRPTLAYDFKGNLLEKQRRVISDADMAAGWTADWSQPNAASALETGGYRTNTRFDALNRPITISYPEDVNGHRAMLRPRYNRAGALEAVTLDGQDYVKRIAYNAKGQRILIVYGNDVLTRYAYDPQTFRLARLRTERLDPAASTALAYQPTGAPLQDYVHSYDLIGNIMGIEERVPGCGIAQPAYDLNHTLDRDRLVREFGYDAIYRLVSANGRACQSSAPRPFQDLPVCGSAPANFNQANAPDLTEPYAESYVYDPAGNMLELTYHSGNGPAQNRWTRTFGMGGKAPADWAQAPDNRLTRLEVGRNPANIHIYVFDDNGNLTQENTERHFTWDHADRMIGFRNQATPASTPSVEARYLYDAGGMRVKKWVRSNGPGDGESTTYIDGVFEHYRWGSRPGDQNNMLHVMDNQSRVALKRVGAMHPDDKGPDVQYHLGDHLGSSNVVIGGQAATGNAFINREEFYPYGETSFGSFGQKRYRFTGKERDEEGGLYYHGARYYAPWLARWASCDPLLGTDGLNIFEYTRNNPLRFSDPTGSQTNDESSRAESPAQYHDLSDQDIDITMDKDVQISVLPNNLTYSQSAAASEKMRVDTRLADRGINVRPDNPKYWEGFIMEVSGKSPSEWGTSVNKGNLVLFYIPGGAEGFLQKHLAGKNADRLQWDDRKGTTDVNDMLVIFDRNGAFVSVFQLAVPNYDPRTAEIVSKEWNDLPVYTAWNEKYKYQALSVLDSEKARQLDPKDDRKFYWIDMHHKAYTFGCIEIIAGAPAKTIGDVDKFIKGLGRKYGERASVTLFNYDKQRPKHSSIYTLNRLFIGQIFSLKINSQR